MTVRQKLWLCVALAAIPLSLAAGWCWNRSCDSEYFASSRVAVPGCVIARFPGTISTANLEEALLSPEIVAAAADLLQERGIPLPVESRFDSEIDYLLNRLKARLTRDGDRVEIELFYRTPDAERAVAVLTAVVDAGVRALQSLAPEVADAGESDRNQERTQLAFAIEQQQIRIADLQERVAAGNREPLDSVDAASVPALATSLEAARTHRIEAEDQLALAFRDVRAGVAVEQILAHLPDGSAWSSTRDLLGAVLLKEEIRQIEHAHEAAAVVYGRNHPKMVGLRAQLEQARQKVAIHAGGPSDPKIIQASATTDSGDGPPVTSQPVTAQLLATLEDKVRQANVAEQELEQRLAAATVARDERQTLEPQLADARQELAFLQKEHERVRQEITAVRHHAEEHCVSISEAPLLSPETIVPSLPQHLLWAGFAGMMISSGALWRFQQSPIGRSSSVGTSTRTPAHERFHSQQEDNLARLRRLKPVA